MYGVSFLTSFTSFSPFGTLVSLTQTSHSSMHSAARRDLLGKRTEGYLRPSGAQGLFGGHLRGLAVHRIEGDVRVLGEPSPLRDISAERVRSVWPVTNSTKCYNGRPDHLLLSQECRRIPWRLFSLFCQRYLLIEVEIAYVTIS